MNQSHHLTICEYGILERGGLLTDINRLSLIESDWDWLKNKAPQFAQDSGQFIKPIIANRRIALQVCNYVGLIELPSKQVLEILPKTSEKDTIGQSRLNIIKMLTKVYRLPFKQSNSTNIAAFEQPLLEILIGRFLVSVQQLINKGLRFDYKIVEENSNYLRGKLKLHQYAQYPPHKRLNFSVEYNEYLPNRPENRLLHWAVHTVFQWSKDSHHRTHARKIMLLLSEIPASSNPHADMRQWSEQRLMKHYRSVKPWIELILSKQTPLSQKGPTAGLSMLFPMEKLFERYVTEIVKKQLEAGYSLLHDREGGKLAKMGNKHLVSLRPDIQIQFDKKTISIMDVKWKKLKVSDDGSAYNLQRSDLYQMFAYAEKILPQGGMLFLIFPKTTKFNVAQPVIELSKLHTLSLVPFDLTTDELIGFDSTKLVASNFPMPLC